MLERIGLADKAPDLHRGQIIEDGPPERIFTSPDHVRTAEFLRRTLDAGRM